MARLVISSLGTTGDFVPFVPLARALKAGGHAVRVAVNEAMQPLFTRAGLDVSPCGPRFGPEEARRVARAFDGWQPYTEERQQLDRQINAVPENYRDLLAACRGSDLLIAVSIQYAAPLVRKALGIPWVCVFCNAEPLAHEPDAVDDRPLPDADLFLVASSLHFSRPRPERPHLHVTGFWFHDGAEQPGWSEPTTELRRFCDGGRAPLVLLPGSIPVQDPQRVVQVHAEAAARLQRPLVIQEGWAGLGPEQLPSTLKGTAVLFARNLPHDWLLERAAAVITHGTMGIVSKALRAGCPLLVEPYGRDLFFNARRVLALGVGAALNPHQLTVEGVTRILSEKVLTDQAKARANDLAARIRAEEGVRRACDLIEAELRKRWRTS